MYMYVYIYFIYLQQKKLCITEMFVIVHLLYNLNIDQIKFLLKSKTDITCWDKKKWLNMHDNVLRVGPDSRIQIWESQCQYRVCPPNSALMTAVHRLLLIEATTLAWKFCGISFHMLTRSPANFCRFDDCWGSRRTCRRRSISSQTCSMGFKSGEFAGQGSTCTSISFSFMNCWTTRAVCGRALSCWNVRRGPCWRRNGTTTGSMISSWYPHPIRLPYTMITLVRCCAVMPPQIMTDPPP